MSTIEEIEKVYRELEQQDLFTHDDQLSLKILAIRQRMLNKTVVEEAKQFSIGDFFEAAGDLLRNAMKVIDDEQRPKAGSTA